MAFWEKEEFPLGCCSLSRSVIPCPCAIDLLAFLGGNLPPFQRGGVTPSFSTPTGFFPLPPNSAAIPNLEVMIVYLNSTVIAQLRQAGHVVTGEFSLLNGNVIVPRVDGACALMSLLPLMA